ncbi:unnamed protein product [Caenorhabditis auriculariae]|uniref:Uncharacterized protein n=1 Tax=Caenorhabditis auriculariae TaxID=2777116 RepID=A0A8S1GRX7_9PELO|nr:unnamed protein product [Caenorhabditis auriculariae]
MNFFSKPDPKEQMRENKRDLRKANRELESDRRGMERREKELEAEIKKLAKQGHTDSAKQLARQLIQLRNQRTKSVGMSAKISGVQAQQTHLHSMSKMSNVMGQTVNVMKTMEKQMPLDKMAKNMRDFQMAQEKMGLTEEMMNDTLDAIMDDGDEAEQDAIVNQVLDEIGIETNSKLSSLPAMPKSMGQENVSLDDLEKQLGRLRS